MMGFNLSVPPYVRQAMFSRSFNNDDLLPKLRKPVLITHGAKDAVVKPEIVDQHKAGMKHAQVHVMANAGPRRLLGRCSRLQPAPAGVS
jgi:pimeloyl-ACP methyl ester carboxylesterase